MPSGGHNRKASPEMFERVVELLTEGYTRKAIAEKLGVNRGTIERWRSVDSEFDAACLHAIQIGFDARCDRLDEIARTEPDVQRAKLRCDNEKWALERQAPHKYGNKLNVDINQQVDIGPVLAELRSKLLPTSYPSEPIEVESRVISDASQAARTGSEPVSRDDDAEELLS